MRLDQLIKQWVLLDDVSPARELHAHSDDFQAQVIVIKGILTGYSVSLLAVVVVDENESLVRQDTYSSRNQPSSPTI